MQKLTTVCLIGVIACGFFISTPVFAAAHAEDAQPIVKTAELLQYTRIYTGADNETHFEDVNVTFVYKDYGKKIPTVWFPENGIMEAEGFHFVAMPAGWDGGDWHPAPARQYIMPLSGEMWFQVSDGEERVFGVGDVLLVEDTKGKGHISRMVSNGLGLFAVVPMPE